MNPIERVVDHWNVVATAAQFDEITDLLRTAGFEVADDAVEANLGIRSRLFPIAGGGFLELSCELSAGSFAHRGGTFQKDTPKLVGVFYRTHDAAADLARWKASPGGERAMAVAGSWRRQDGTFGYYVGVSPTPPSTVFFGMQERRLFPPPYLDRAQSAPAVRRVTVSGPDAEEWKQRHLHFFELPERSGVLYAGETELVFVSSAATRTEIAVTTEAPNPNVRIPLAAGRIEFVPQTRT